jgi:single stranded DNA-binding protein
LRSSLFLPLFFLGTASGSFLRPAASQLLLSRFLAKWVPPGMQPLAWGAVALAFGVPQKKRGRKRRKDMYLNSVTIVGFAGADPVERQAKTSGTKFVVFSVATQRSWKNSQDEWTSKTEWHRVTVFRPRLAANVLATVRKGAHVLVEGSLISSIYEPENGKGRKAENRKVTSWSIRADAVRKLDRGESDPEAPEATDARSASIDG